MKQFAPALVVVAFLSTPAFAAVNITQRANPADRAFERLPNLRLVRGGKPKNIPLEITADAGEAWTINSDQPWLSVEPASGTGPGTATILFNKTLLNALDDPSAHIAITGPGPGNLVILDVSVDTWPALVNPTSPEGLRT